MVLQFTELKIDTEDGAKVVLQVLVWESLFLHIFFHTNNCKPTFASPYIMKL